MNGFAKYLEQPSGWLMLFLTAAGTWYFTVDHLAVRMAWDGQSPNLLAIQYMHPDWFAGDFPSGTSELLKSAPMAIYLLGAKLGIDAIFLMKGLIAIEIVLLAGTTVWATRKLFPEISSSAICLTAVLMIAGNFRMPDLGRWSDPSFGWVYGYAEAAVIAAVVAACGSRPVLCAFFLAAAFLCHPVLAIFGCVFSLSVLAPAWRDLDAPRLATAVALFGVVATAYFAAVAATSGLNGGGIPAHLYIAITRMESFHWYPVDMGLFWERHWERLFPFLAETLLLVVYLPDGNGELRDHRVGLAIGFAAMLVLTAAGVLLSVVASQPFVIKLALQRASSVYLLVALLIIAPGLWKDAMIAGRLRGWLAILTVFSCFTAAYGVPALYGLALASLVVWADFQTFGWTFRARLLTIVSSVLLLLWIFYAANGVVDWHNEQYWGALAMSPARLVLVLAFAGGVVLVRGSAGLSSVMLKIAVIGLGLLLARSTDPFAKDPALLKQEEDYLSAQLWARNNTAAGSLFMPDPTHYYGWREFSARPSFGNLREWFYNGWAYNSNLQVLERGLVHLHAMGMNLAPYLALQNRMRPGDAALQMSDDLQKRYYSLDKDGMRALAHRFGISYFVFDTGLRKTAIDAPIVYRNDHYVIVRSPTLH